MSWLVIRALLGGALKKLLAFLGSLNVWQIALIAALILAGVQTLRLHAEQRHSHKVETQLVKATDELTRISKSRDDQKATTKENIKIVEKIIHDADGRARIVEKAPPAPNCKTKPEVMGADL